jgi:hypothetical protein
VFSIPLKAHRDIDRRSKIEGNRMKGKKTETMGDTSKDRAVGFLEAAHKRLATFASESYALDGRGFVLVRVPDVKPGTRRMSTEMVYRSLSDARQSTADCQASARADADVLLRMIETYDPIQQAVVTVDFETGHPITVKMKLERPFITDEATGQGDNYFEQEEAFREAHAACVADRLEYAIWLPHGLVQASVTVKCACGAKTTIACTSDVARATLEAFKMNGIPVSASKEGFGSGFEAVTEQVDDDLLISRCRLRLFNAVKKQLTSDYECCLWPFSKCTLPAIRAHSIQNGRVLDALCADGHVVMPKLNATPKQSPVVTFRKVGRNDASTFTGLCALHDQELFRPIDVAPVDVKSPHHLFLLAYRALFKEVHASRKAAVDIQTGYVRGAEQGLWPRGQPSPAGMLAVERMAVAYYLHRVQQEFDQAFAMANWRRLDHQVLTLNVGPTLAVSSMFSTGTYSEVLDDDAYVYLNVLPIKDQTVAIFSFLADQRTEAETAYSDVWAATDEHQRWLLSKLVLRKCENLVLAPLLFDTFSAGQRDIIHTYYQRNILDQTFELDDPRLTLFESVS